MAGSETTPGAVTKAHSYDHQHPILLGPLARIISVSPDYPFASGAIKAIWRNEVGTA